MGGGYYGVETVDPERNAIAVRVDLDILVAEDIYHQSSPPAGHRRDRSPCKKAFTDSDVSGNESREPWAVSQCRPR